MCCAPKPVGRLPIVLRRVSQKEGDKNAQHQAKLEGTNDARTGMPFGIPKGAMCVQRFDDSLNSAIHTTYRISLRSSSMPEPRDPLLKVVINYIVFTDADGNCIKKKVYGLVLVAGEPAQETTSAQKTWVKKYFSRPRSQAFIFCCVMIPPQVHLRRPCYDFYFL